MAASTRPLRARPGLATTLAAIHELRRWLVKRARPRVEVSAKVTPVVTLHIPFVG